MSDAMNEERDAKHKLLQDADRTGLCTEFKVFSLGANGTAYVSCGLPSNHKDWERSDEDTYSVLHLTRQEFSDGSSIIFRWPA